MKFVQITVGLILLFSSAVHAALVSVAGPNSSAGTAPMIISAPQFAQNGLVFNSGQQGFDERQDVLLLAPLDTDDGVGAIATGTRVSSHMIFLNKESGVAGTLSHSNVDWTFDGEILGVMSDRDGNLEAASTPILGAPGTTYQAPFSARGMEGDSYLIMAGLKTLRVNMAVGQPGDWIRVVTASAIPLPAAFWLFGTALIGFIGYSRRRIVT